MYDSGRSPSSLALSREAYVVGSALAELKRFPPHCRALPRTGLAGKPDHGEVLLAKLALQLLEAGILRRRPQSGSRTVDWSITLPRSRPNNVAGPIDVPGR